MGLNRASDLTPRPMYLEGSLMLSLLVVVVEGETFQDGGDIDSDKGENSCCH